MDNNTNIEYNDFKPMLIELIKSGEQQAKETVEISLNQDLYKIDKNKINSKHYNKMLSHLISNTINEYEEIQNIYKASNEQFDFLNNQIRNEDVKELNDNDRLDFTATVFKSYLDWKPEEQDGIARKIDAVNQMQNLENIVFETKSLELKKIAFVEIIKKLDIKAKTNEGKPQQTEISHIENEFDHVDINKVYDFFYKELVKTNFLTDAQLRHYLKAAFEQEKPPKDRFTFKNDPQKSIITNIFYRYYTDIAARGRKKGYRKECASLLGEYFNGYNTKTVINNFNK